MTTDGNKPEPHAGEIEAAAKATYWCMNAIMHDHDQVWRDCKQQEVWRDVARAALQSAARVDGPVIRLTSAEIQCNHNRVRWAEGLIEQLPPEHEGRNSWLLNYGVNSTAKKYRTNRGIGFNEASQAVNPPALAQVTAPDARAAALEEINRVAKRNMYTASIIAERWTWNNAIETMRSECIEAIRALSTLPAAKDK